MATWLVLLSTLVRWRLREFYAGGVDPVVAMKGLLGVAALGMAFSAMLRSPIRRPVGTRSAWLVLIYVTAATLGGWAAGDAIPTAVLAVRVMVVAATVYLLLIAYPVAEILRTLFTAMVALAAFGSVTGVGSVLSGGRLSGGIPPMQSNEIALLITPAMIGLAWRVLHHRAKSYDLPALVALLGVLWLTGSRTTLAAVMVALVVLIVQVKRVSFGSIFVAVAAIPAVAILIFTTNLVTGFVERDGTGNVGTLNSRTIAWNSAFTMPKDFWQSWFGGGFTMMTVPVSGTYWDTQVLDSSWVSGYVQAGAIGMGIMAAMFAFSLISASRARRAARALWTAQLVNILIDSITKSGLIGWHVLFVTFFVTVVLSEYPVRSSRRLRQSSVEVARYGARSERPAVP